MTEDIPCTVHTAAAFLDNLRIFTHFSNFLDPDLECSSLQGFLRNWQSQRKVSSSTKTREFPNPAETLEKPAESSAVQ